MGRPFLTRTEPVRPVSRFTRPGPDGGSETTWGLMGSSDPFCPEVRLSLPSLVGPSSLVPCPSLPCRCNSRFDFL